MRHSLDSDRKHTYRPGSSGVNTLQHKKNRFKNDMNLAARTVQYTVLQLRIFVPFDLHEKSVDVLNAGPNVGLYVCDWEV